MKFTAAVLLAFSSSVFAATVADLPACSIPCFTTAITSTSCGVTDYTCQCTTGKDAITAAVQPCVVKACSAADQAKVLQVSNDICASVGVSTSSASGSNASSAAASASSKATSLASAASSAASVASSAAAAATSNAAVARGVEFVGAGAAVFAAGMLAL